MSTAGGPGDRQASPMERDQPHALYICASMHVFVDGVSSEDAWLGFVRSGESVWNKLPRRSAKHAASAKARCLSSRSASCARGARVVVAGHPAEHAFRPDDGHVSELAHFAWRQRGRRIGCRS